MEEVRKQFETNFFGVVQMIQHVLPHMRKQGSGAIVNFSSVAALNTLEGSAFYGASKCAVEGVSSGLQAVEEKEGPSHLLLGSVAVEFAENVFAARAEEVQKWKALSVQTDAGR